eukprot:5075180-Pyramimonas_sp.AAC.1
MTLSPPEAGRKGGLGVSPETSSPLKTLKLKKWRQLYKRRAGGFRNVALALATRALVIKICESLTD